MTDRIVVAEIGVATNEDGTFFVEMLADGKLHMKWGPFDDRDIAIMVAREVAERMAAKPAGSH